MIVDSIILVIRAWAHAHQVTWGYEKGACVRN